MRPCRPIGLLVAALAWGAALAAHAGPAAAADWPQWRGPNRDGVSAETGWLASWPPEGPKILWRAAVGAGYAAVSVAGGRAYTMGSADGQDAVWCLAADSGAVLWKHTYACPGGGGGFPGPRAAPQVDGRSVYTLSVEGHLFCLDAESGRVVWARDLRKDLGASPPRHGMACHPLIVGERLILEGGAPGGSVIALHKATGALLWKSGDEPVGYSSPVTYRAGDRTCLAVLGGSALVGMDPADGQTLWRYPWKVPYEIVCATPVVSGATVFISAGYGLGCALVDATAAAPKTVWRNLEMSNHFASCVLWKGHLYGFDGAPGAPYDAHTTRLKCLDAGTGRARWSQEGLGKGSLMAADGRLILLGERGELVIADASPDRYAERARAKVLGDTCWTMPVLADGRIYCRNYPGDLVCVDVRPERKAP